MQYPATHLSLSREQLYELVWSKPMQHIAKDFDVSDRAMANVKSGRIDFWATMLTIKEFLGIN